MAQNNVPISSKLPYLDRGGGLGAVEFSGICGGLGILALHQLEVELAAGAARDGVGRAVPLL